MKNVALRLVQELPRSEEYKTILFYPGPLSQWWYSPFIIDDIQYNCAEQYMMAQKARVFGDDDIADRIMNFVGPHTTQREFNKYPKQYQKLGRQVSRFNNERWQAVARDIVMRATMAKFTQNHDLLIALLSTKGYTLCEASPFDNIWGIKMGMDDKNAFNPENWCGSNWLGQILTEFRDMMLI